MAKLQVRELAEKQGITLSELQRRSGLSMRTVRRNWYETANGNVSGKHTEELTWSVLEALAKALNVRVSELIQDE
jgi:transcriptional regulator with XRE-family HTH domain